MTDPLRRSPYRRSGTVILLAPLLAPAWNVIVLRLPGVSLTIGRALIVLSAALLLLDAWRAREQRPRVPRPLAMLLVTVGLLWAWATVNTVIWGCRCAGELAGFSELLALGVLAALVASFEPRLQLPLVVAVVAGAALSALLAVAGVEGLTATSMNQSEAEGRLAGPYGNPNMLGYTIAFAIPAGLALLHRREDRVWLLLAGTLALTAGALLFTYSRGGLIAAATGAMVVLVLRQPPRSRARRRTIVGFTVVLTAAVLVYPVFANLRREASTPTIEPERSAEDRSGWNPGAQGLIPTGPAAMTNPSFDVLDVRLSGPGGGVSHDVGATASEHRIYELRFLARTLTETGRIRFGLEDNLLGNGRVLRESVLTPEWKPLRVRWRPSADSPDARLYVWSEASLRRFRIRDVVVLVLPNVGPPTRLDIPVRLMGPLPAEPSPQAWEAIETRELESRKAGIELSLSAFASQPLRGIGWGHFRDLADARTDFGRLPTHNEYVRFLAELGGMGALLLALGGVIVGFALLRGDRDDLGLALVGMVVTGGVGLLFVNGLVTSALTIPLAFAVAAACARAQEPAPTQEHRSV